MIATNGNRPRIDLTDVDAFAEVAHAGQERASGVPYIDHPRAVRAILENEYPESVDDETLAVALLHDVLEDCDVHPSILLNRWGRLVQEGVTMLSWRIRALEIERDQHMYWSGVRRGPRLVRLVKAADRIDNLRGTIADGDPRRREKYLIETREHLIPILEEAGEMWWVRELEALLDTLEETAR